MDHKDPEFLLSKVKELDRQLSDTRRLDPDAVHHARHQLKGACVDLLCEHYELALRHDVETPLWKKCFYAIRMYYCDKLKKCRAPGDHARVAEAYKNFLAESIHFYHMLFREVQYRNNLDLRGMVDEALIHRDWSPSRSAESNNKAVMRACTRCLIAIGDLTRYHRDLGKHPAQKEWASASQYYDQALNLSPDQGNAHNQLAVLAAYLDNNFNAVYRYMRSLAVRNPFLMARENLVKQFHTCNELLAPYMAIIDGGTRNKRRGGGSKKTPVIERGQEESVFWLALIRLQGILFTQIGTETFSPLKQWLLREFSTLVMRDTFNEKQLLRIVVTMIFSIHSLAIPRDAVLDPQQHAEYFQSISGENTLQQQAIACLVELMMPIITRASRACKEQGDDQARPSRYLPPLTIFLQWLSMYPDAMTAANAPRSVVEKRRQFWSAMATLGTYCHRSRYNSTEMKELMQDRTLAPPLEEEIELRGFLCLEPVHKDLPSAAEYFRLHGSFDVDARVLAQVKVDHSWSVPQLLRIMQVLDFLHKVASTPGLNVLHFSEQRGKFGAKGAEGTRPSKNKRSQDRERGERERDSRSQNGSSERTSSSASSEPIRIAAAPGKGGKKMSVGACPHVPKGSSSPSSRGYMADPAASAALANSMKEKEVMAAQRLTEAASPPASPLRPSPESELSFKPGQGTMVSESEKRDGACPPAIGSGRERGAMSPPNMFSDAPAIDAFYRPNGTMMSRVGSAPIDHIDEDDEETFAFDRAMDVDTIIADDDGATSASSATTSPFPGGNGDTFGSSLFSFSANGGGGGFGAFSHGRAGGDMLPPSAVPSEPADGSMFYSSEGVAVQDASSAFYWPAMSTTESLFGGEQQQHQQHQQHQHTEGSWENANGDTLSYEGKHASVEWDIPPAPSAAAAGGGVGEAHTRFITNPDERF